MLDIRVGMRKKSISEIDTDLFVDMCAHFVQESKN